MFPLIFQSDFGVQDGAVSAMHGVAYNVSSEIRMFDLTHEIQPYNIWEASYRLIQTVNYWPAGAVFVSVVDPGVGSDRLSIVAKTKTGQFIVTPDNGTLTHVKRMLGLAEVRVIDEKRNRLPGSEECYTFYGRDVYAFTGARLAAGEITFEEVGEPIECETVIELPVTVPEEGANEVNGTIDVLDIRFGSLWTNIPKEMFDVLGIQRGDRAEVTIVNDIRTVYRNTMVYGHSFAEVSIGEPILYTNSLGCMAVAINQGSFARAYSVGTGNSWRIRIRKVPEIYY